MTIFAASDKRSRLLSGTFFFTQYIFIYQFLFRKGNSRYVTGTWVHYESTSRWTNAPPHCVRPDWKELRAWKGETVVDTILFQLQPQQQNAPHNKKTTITKWRPQGGTGFLVFCQLCYNCSRNGSAKKPPSRSVAYDLARILICSAKCVLTAAEVRTRTGWYSHGAAGYTTGTHCRYARRTSIVEHEPALWN